MRRAPRQMAEAILDATHAKMQTEKDLENAHFLTLTAQVYALLAIADTVGRLDATLKSRP